MSSHKADRVERVLSGVLRAWGVSATVERDAEQPAFMVRTPSTTLRIVREGWLVFRDGELLATHAGLPGLLRSLRQELAPHAAAGRLVIGTQELA